MMFSPRLSRLVTLIRRNTNLDTLFLLATIVCALMIVAVALGIFEELVRHSIPAMKRFGLDFIVSTDWNPVRGEFGALPSLFGTVTSTVVAMLVAVPMSLAIALFLAELAPRALSVVVSTGIELLAAIPSIVYGMWGLFVFAPFMAEYVQPGLQGVFGFLPLFSGPPMGIGILTAGIILALMVIPFISALMKNIFEMVPDVVKEAGYGLGATTWEVTRFVTLPYGKSALLGACFLGLGRAIGETMAVTFVIGNTHKITSSLFAPGTSIASTLANEFTEASEPLYLSVLVELGLVLFVVTFLIQLVAHLWLKAVQKKISGVQT